MAVDGRRVIAGVSGSLRSLGALRAGVDEARETGAPLLAVLAWVPAGGELAYRRAPCPVLLKLWEQVARERLTEAFDAALGGVPADVTVRGMVVRGRAGPLLVELADQPDDLLIVGCGGRNWLSSSVHGSVTRYCMAHAHCRVLAIPPPELMTAVRSRPHRWRPEDFAAPLGGPAAAGPAAETPRRAATATYERPGEQAQAKQARRTAWRTGRGRPARLSRRAVLPALPAVQEGQDDPAAPAGLHPHHRDAAGRADRNPARPEPAVTAAGPERRPARRPRCARGRSGWL